MLGIWSVKVAVSTLFTPSQKKPLLVKEIVACFTILILKVFTIGAVQGEIGLTVKVKLTKVFPISAAVGV